MKHANHSLNGHPPPVLRTKPDALKNVHHTTQSKIERATFNTNKIWNYTPRSIVSIVRNATRSKYKPPFFGKKVVTTQ